MIIGRKIYFDKMSGDVIIDIGERVGDVQSTTVEQDIQTYKALSERNRETFDYIELEYGMYSQDFEKCNGYKVNLKTKQIEFSYPNPNDTAEPPTYQAPLSVEVKQLQEDNAMIAETLAIALTEIEELKKSAVLSVKE